MLYMRLLEEVTVFIVPFVAPENFIAFSQSERTQFCIVGAVLDAYMPIESGESIPSIEAPAVEGYVCRSDVNAGERV